MFPERRKTIRHGDVVTYDDLLTQDQKQVDRLIRAGRLGAKPSKRTNELASLGWLAAWEEKQP